MGDKGGPPDEGEKQVEIWKIKRVSFLVWHAHLRHTRDLWYRPALDRRIQLHDQTRTDTAQLSGNLPVRLVSRRESVSRWPGTEPSDAARSCFAYPVAGI